MINETAAAILARLGEIAGVATVDDWVGDIDELMGQSSHRLPGLFVVYGGAVYGGQEVIGVNQVPGVNTWTVVVAARDLRGRSASAAACYDMIKAARAKLIGFDTGFGKLCPLEEKLLGFYKGATFFGLNYIIDHDVEGDA